MLSGNSLRQTVHTHHASVHQAAKLVAALLRVAGVTAGISCGTLRSVVEYGLPLPARLYASVVTSYGPVSMSMSVCVCHKSVFCRKGWTNQAGFWLGSFFRSVIHSVTIKFRYLQKWGYFPLELCSKLWTVKRKFRHSISIVRMCYQLSSRKLDAQSVINWTVVVQLSW